MEAPEASGRLAGRHVGIALAAYRPDPAYFSAQLDSIAAQSHAHWTCWVRLDSPLAPLRDDPALARYFQDARFVFAENAGRLGHLGNFSAAMAEAAASGVAYIACADQDDVWDADKLTECVALLSRSPPLSLVHCDLRIEGEESTVWQREGRGVDLVDVAHLVIRNVVNGAACVMDADLVRRYPGVPAEASFHDHWYAALAAAHGGVHAVRRPLMTYRLHGGNVVGSAAQDGVASVAPGLGPVGAVGKARREWRDAARFRDALGRAGVPFPVAWRPWLGRTPDLGLGLALAALRYRRRDPKLARACLKKALGRLFSPGR